MAWNTNKSYGQYGAGQQRPGGSFGKSIGYVNDDPFSHNTSMPRPFGGFGMDAGGSYNKRSAGGPMNISAPYRGRRRLYLRRGFGGMMRNAPPMASLSGMSEGEPI